MADMHGMVAGSAEGQELHPSYWNWLMSGERGNGIAANGNGSANGHAAANGNGLAHTNGNGLAHANGVGNGRLTKDVALGIVTPTSLARRLARN